MHKLVGRLQTALASERTRRLLLLAGIMTVLGYYKILLSDHTFSTNVDGGYYTSIAINVRDGHGFLTNVSLLHKGYAHFPHQSEVYPLWPLLYGYVARLFPVLAVGIWLPTILYFGTLLVAYGWASEVFPGSLYPRTLTGFNAGHVIVMMLGLVTGYFATTSQPYTEGLAYFLLFFALWHFHRLWPKPNWRSGLEMGLWSGMLILARTQLVVVALAVFASLAYGVVMFRQSRRRYAVMAATCALGFAVVIGLRILHLRSFAPDAGFNEVLHWEHIRYCDALPLHQVLEDKKGLWDYVSNILEGFSVAFALDGKYAYRHQYHAFQYAIVAAVPIMLLSGAVAASRQNLRRAWDWLRRSENLGYVFVVVLALGSFLAIHTLRRTDGAWYFSRRYVVMCVFAFFLAMLFLLRHKRFLATAVGTFILCAGFVQGTSQIRTMAIKQAKKRPAPYAPALVQWVKQQAENKPGLVIAMRQPQMISWHTPEVGYHWFHHTATQRTIETMVTELGADYLILPKRKRLKRQRRDFSKKFESVGVKSGMQIYRATPLLLEQRKRRP